MAEKRTYRCTLSEPGGRSFDLGLFVAPDLEKARAMASHKYRGTIGALECGIWEVTAIEVAPPAPKRTAG